ncbi:hypothetical protein LPJ56_006470, partial [Coemansia sp. RSA 2599]
ASPYGPETPERMFPEAQHQPSDSYHEDIGPGGFFAPPRAPTNFSLGGGSSYHSGQASPSPFNGAMPPFPGQPTYPPFPEQGGANVYPPPGQQPYPPLGPQPYPPDAKDSGAAPALFAQAPYPPLEPSSAAQQPTHAQAGQSSGQASSAAGSCAADVAGASADAQLQDGQGLARHDASSNQQVGAAGSLGAGLHTLAPSQVPPGVPLPIGQSSAHPENAGVEGTHKSASDSAGNSGKQMAFLNVSDNETVHQRFLIVSGQVAGIKGDQDKIVVHHPFFPPLTFPAIDGYFKALVELESGPNDLKFDYLQNGESLSQGKLSIKMTPYLDKPPLHLAVL